MNRVLTFPTAVLLSLILPVSSFAQSGENWSMWGHYGWGWGGMLFGSLMMIVFWGGIVLLTVLLVRAFGGNGGQTISQQMPSSVAPLDILKERFAKGEIDKKEYEERKKTLSE